MELRNVGPLKRLSWSVVASYLRCPYCCYCEHVLHLPHKTSIALPIGSAIHAGWGSARTNIAVLADRSDEELRALIAPAALGTAVNEYVNALREPGRVFDDDEAAEGLAVVEWALDGMWDSILEERFMLQNYYVEVEQWLRFDGVFPFRFSGRADILLGNAQDDIVQIRDLKTSKATHAMDIFELQQLSVYTIPFLGVMREPMKVAVDRITLGTKKPIMHRYEDEVTPEFAIETYDLIMSVADRMSRDKWEPFGRELWTCGFHHP